MMYFWTSNTIMRQFTLLLYILLTGIIFLSGCVPVSEKKKEADEFQVNMESMRPIYTLGLHQRTDSLIHALSSENSLDRYAAAIAFISFQDTAAIGGLLKLLSDPNGEIRAVAATALGQIGSASTEKPLSEAFDGSDSARTFVIANSAILEAIGKVGSAQFLQNLGTINSYTNRDTLLLLGQVRGIYRYALRGMTHPEGTGTIINYISDPGVPFEVRLIAAQYLTRIKGTDLQPYSEKLMGLWHSETKPEIRMCLATAIGRLNTKEARELLQQTIKTESDQRVVCNMLRSIQEYPYEDVAETYFQFVKENNPHWATLAGQYFITHGKEKDVARYRALMNECPTWFGKTAMGEAANIHTTSLLSSAKSSLTNELEGKINGARDNYEKAAWLKAFAAEPRNFESIPKYFASSNPPVVRTQAVQSLVDICKNKRMDFYFPGEAHLIKNQIGGYLGQAIRTEDPGILALLAGTVSEEGGEMKGILKDRQDDLKKALAGLKIPQDLEAYVEISKALKEYGTDSPAIPDEQKKVKPVDWSLIDQIKHSSRVTIHTNKGAIVMALRPDDAPESVSSFIQLIQSGYYNGKAFHRVVPNFVIQTGCPRGDGYGSNDFTLRSELHNTYYDDAGYVGMASAGLHTEGSQFFITHSPTPHLDGRYTIIGKVISGMDVVNSISVGDLIQKVDITF